MNKKKDTSISTYVITKNKESPDDFNIFYQIGNINIDFVKKKILSLIPILDEKEKIINIQSWNFLIRRFNIEPQSLREESNFWMVNVIKDIDFNLNIFLKTYKKYLKNFEEFLSKDKDLFYGFLLNRIPKFNKYRELIIRNSKFIKQNIKSFNRKLNSFIKNEKNKLNSTNNFKKLNKLVDNILNY